MALKNWWIEVDIDGRIHQLTGGPRNKDGGFRLVINQRDKGVSVTAVVITGHANRNGQLTLTVRDSDDSVLNKSVLQVRTER